MKQSLTNLLTASYVALAALTVGAFVPTAAEASGTLLPARTCAGANGFTLRNFEEITINLAEGDALTLSSGAVVPRVVPAAPSGPQYRVTGGVRTTLLPGSSVTIVGSATITTVDIAAVGYLAGMTCTPAGAGAGAGAGAFTASVGTIGANSQTGATRNGISNNTQNRLGGGGGNTATQNRVFLSTQNLPGAAGQFGQPDWNAWISAEGRNYSGDLDGWSADVVAGVDTLVRDDLLIGALLAYGRVDITSPTRSAEVTSVALGAYFAKRFQGDLFLDGFISFAEPEYTTDGTQFTARRTSASLSLTGSYTGGNFLVTPVGKLAAYREEQPAYTGTSGAVAANTVRNVNLNLGAKVEPLAPLANGILPYVSLSMDYGRNSSTASGTQSFVSPRLGVGFGAELGAGYLSVDLDAGKVQRGVRDVGLRAVYEFKF